MAVSLALNWNLPASTPLFDESSPLHSDEQSKSNVTASPLPDTARASPSTIDGPSQKSNGIRQASGDSATPSAATKSYAAAASSSSSSTAQSFPQIPMPSYTGAGLSGQHNYASLNANPHFNHGTWAGQFQPNNKGSPNQFVSEDGRRIRSTSGPQKPSHLTYNDTLQHYPGPHPSATQSRSALPPGAMQPSSGGSGNNTLPHTASNPNITFHPYRRTTKGSDAPQVSSTFAAGRGPPVLPMPGQIAQTLPRARTASTNSSGSPRIDTNVSRIPPSAAPITYSSVASGAVKAPTLPQNSNQISSSRRPMGFTETPVSPQNNLGMQREVSGSTDSFASASSDLRTRKASVSSQSSSSDRNASHTFPVNGQGNVSNGRTTPVQRKPAPSPLSRTKPFNDEDGQAKSDDENTIGGRTTPTPGDKQKKGLSGKLRKALSLSTLQQVEAAAAAPDRAYGGRTNVVTRRPDGSHFPHASLDTNGSSGSTRSTSPPRTPDNGVPLTGSSAASITSRKSSRPPIAGTDGGGTKRSIFNRKFNSSTDNISISSTVSSASMMLRKVGNLGKLARRSNIKGITNMFNKDKDAGREGLHNDDFGTLPTSSQHDRSASETPNSRKEKLSGKKGTPASASVSHATVELEARPNSSFDAGMTPAASYVRQHQLQMRAEAERIAKEKAEAERRAMNNSEARSINSNKADSNNSQLTMIEKEKERLKNKRGIKGGWRKRLVGSLGSSSEVEQATGLETIPLERSVDSQTPVQVIGQSYGIPASSSIGAPSQLSSSGSTTLHNANGNFNETSFDSAFDEDDLEPPHMPGANEGYESGDDFETDSLRHWGEGIERSRESAARIKSVKGILKNSNSFNEQMSAQQFGSAGAIEKPFAGRIRANSYDAPQGAGQHNSSVPLMSQISTSASTDRVDGVARASEDKSRPDIAPIDEKARIGGASTPTQGSATNLGHHPNSSMPTLSLMMNPNASNAGQRSMTTPQAKRRLVFADAHIYHSTWPAHVYDRRGELATCNRLTPLLAQRIKEELNTYKMEEMAVAPSSRIHTHFFV